MSALHLAPFGGARAPWRAALLVVGLCAQTFTALAAPPTISCNSTAAVFNTGVDPALTGVLANGSSDANWEVTDLVPITAPIPTAPPAGPVWYPAIVGNTVPGAWDDSPVGNAQWISREYGLSLTGDWYYRYRFNLDPSVDASQYGLNLSILVDNSIAEIYVNGVPQSGQLGGVLPQSGGDYNYAGFKLANRFSVALSHNWQTGPNELIVLVHSGRDYEGFMAYVSGPPVCRLAAAPPTTSVPTLGAGSMTMLTLVLGLLGWRTTRRRSARAA